MKPSTTLATTKLQMSISPKTSPSSTTTTSSCLIRCSTSPNRKEVESPRNRKLHSTSPYSEAQSPHFNTWCGDWVYSKTPCSSQLSDGFKIFLIAVDNCNKHPVKRHLLLLPNSIVLSIHLQPLYPQVANLYFLIVPC